MTLAELEQVYGKGATGAGALFDKVTAAVLKAAEVVRVEVDTTANHANRLLWAKRAFRSPVAVAEEMWGALLAVNAGVTQTQLLNGTDNAIETAVKDAINIFATGASA